MKIKEPAQIPPCVSACPIHIDIPRYIRAIGNGDYEEAQAVIREKLPFPSVCGRICFHPCEAACNANHLLDRGPVAINALKRFIFDGNKISDKCTAPTAFSGKSVAIVGSGPAGLTAAYYLRKLGHSVVVFEALPEAGGMVKFGIPDYRLPKDILSSEIEHIRNIGVEIKVNCKINKPGKLLEEGYDAVFVAIGAHKTVKMGIEGEDLPGVLDSIDFMKDINLGKSVDLGAKLVVIGGGNAAIDAARSGLRLGCKDVTIFYRRSKGEMPASENEVKQAMAEGVQIRFLVLPTRILFQGDKLKIHCVETTLEEASETCGKIPEASPGSDFVTTADRIILAVGHVPEIPEGFDLGIKHGKIDCADVAKVDTNTRGVFAGGDAVTGPASFIEAIAAGREGARSIDKYLGGDGKIDNRPLQSEKRVIKTELQGFPIKDREQMPMRSIEERLTEFSSVELGFTEEQARNEAKRCLQCDLPITVNPEACTGCLTCVMRCSLRFDRSFCPTEAQISVIPYADEKVNEIRFSDNCDTCGICARYCPHDALYRGEQKS